MPSGKRKVNNDAKNTSKAKILTSKKRLVPFLLPASLLVHGDIRKPLDDVQGNFSYSMKISVNNETLKVFLYYPEGAKGTIDSKKYGTLVLLKRQILRQRRYS